MNKQEYHEYLRSPEWKNKRALVLQWHGRECADCGAREAWLRGTTFHVHHLTYKNVGNEWPWELIPLCPECHEGRHTLGYQETIEWLTIKALCKDLAEKMRFPTSPLVGGSQKGV